MEHCAQAPEAKHAPAVGEGHGRDATEPLSPLHAWQVLDPVSQTGAPAGHAPLDVQPHVWLLRLQLGLTLLHAVTFVPEHCSHVPPTHAGRDVAGHASVAPDPLSPLHAWQM